MEKDDGVGALTKRTADTGVANGRGVQDFEALFNLLNESIANCWHHSVTSDSIKQFDEELKLFNMPTFQVILKVHQWIWCRCEPLEIKFN